MSEDVLFTLKRARALIDTPQKWTKGAYARDKHDFSVSPLMGQATCFCTLGAILRASSERRTHGFGELADEVEEYIATVRGLEPEDRIIAYWNDDPATDHNDLMETFDKAIILAGGINV